MNEATDAVVVEDNTTKLFVPAGTGPYSVESTTYQVNSSDNSITVEHHPEHIPQLLALGATHVPPASAPAYGARVQSEFGPSQDEHDALRAKFEALTTENETVIGELATLRENTADDLADLVAVREQTSQLADTILELGLSPVENEGACDAAGRLLREQQDIISGLRADADAAAASGDTSENLDEAEKVEDPGFTENSDYGEITQWLKDHGAVVPGNISKANALKAIAEIVDGKQGE